MKTITNIIYPAFALFAFACFALAPQARATCQDACLTNNNTVQGDDALISLTTGINNTAVGFQALNANTSASFNTATGWEALAANTIGNQNTADGNGALFANTSGNNNTATGSGALGSNTTGSVNTATGSSALGDNTTGFANTAFGNGALEFNTVGIENTATGFNALQNNTTGQDNTANGHQALRSNTTGNRNTANGVNALDRNTTGTSNTAVGAGALSNHTTGESNTAVGRDALVNDTLGESNTAIGRSALANNTTGVTNIAIGTDSGSRVTTGSNVVCIGFGVEGANVDDTTWIGNIFGVTTQSGMTAPVIVSNNGQLGTVASSERFKKDITNMQKTSEAILALRPVTFHYKTDAGNTLQFGLIAEEVAKVNPALVLPDKEGKPYTVRYDAVNAMLLNEFLKEHKKVEEQQSTIGQLKSLVAQQQKGFEAKLAKQEEQIETLSAGLQKVSAQLELSKSAPEMVLNNH